MKRTCEWCGASIITTRADARYCSSQHRIYAHRSKRRSGIPQEMLEQRRWLRWKLVKRGARYEKVPMTVAGRYASSTDPTTWATYEEASKSGIGEGLGYALGEGIGCIDLDHCIVDGKLTPAAERFVVAYPQNYIEVSPSGDGLHIWGLAAETYGTKQNIDGLSIETYSAGRYITITGNIWQHGTLLPL